MSASTIDYDALAKKHGAQGVDYDSLAQQHGGTAADDQAAPPAKPSFFSDPRGYLTSRVADLKSEAQRQQNLYMGPEGDAITARAATPIGKALSYAQRFGHGVASMLPETAAAVDSAVLGASQWKNAVPIALGAIDPAIPAAHFATQGTANLTGINGPSSVKTAIDNPSPDNVGSVLNDAAMVTGSAGVDPAIGGSRGAFGNIPSKIMRGVDRVALGKTPPARLLTKALKPPVTYPEFENVVSKRLPEIADKTQGKPISSVNDFENTVDGLAAEKNQQYQDVVAPYRRPPIGPYRESPINATPVADAQMSSIPPLDLFEKPNRQVTIQRGGHHVVQGDAGILEKTNELAAPFRRNVPLADLDAIRVDTNAKLKSFYDKAGGDQYAALSNPETARVKAINDTSRDLVYDRLLDETGKDVRPIQEAQGDFKDLGDVAGKRGTVYSRQQPFPLQEQINAADALAQGNPVKFGLSKLFSRYGNSDVLTKIAMDRFNRGRTTTLPTPIARRPVIGMIARSIHSGDDDE